MVGNVERGVPVTADGCVGRSIRRREAVAGHPRKCVGQESMLQCERVFLRPLELLRPIEGLAELVAEMMQRLLVRVVEHLRLREREPDDTSHTGGPGDRNDHPRVVVHLLLHREHVRVVEGHLFPRSDEDAIARPRDHRRGHVDGQRHVEILIGLRGGPADVPAHHQFVADEEMERAGGRAHARERLVEKDAHDIVRVRRAHQPRCELVQRSKARTAAVTNRRHVRAGLHTRHLRRPDCSFGSARHRNYCARSRSTTA